MSTPPVPLRSSCVGILSGLRMSVVTHSIRGIARTIILTYNLVELQGESDMKGTYLKFYVHENRKHHHRPIYEWLLEQAKQVGIHGASAFRAIAGFGRHGVLHEQQFFELAGDLTVEVVFAITDEEADRLLKIICDEQLSLFYVRMPVECGTTSGIGLSKV